MLTNQWDHIIRLVRMPQSENETAEYVRRMALTNFIVVACFAVNLIGVVFDYFLAYNAELIALDMLGVVFFGVLVALHRRLKRQVFTATVLFSSLLIYITYMSVFFGKEVFIILYLYNLIIASFFMFDIRTWIFKGLIFCALISMLWLEFYGFNMQAQMQFSAAELTNLRLFSITANILLFVVLVVIMDRGIRRVQVALISNRKRVEELSDRLQMLCNLKEEYNTSLLQQRDSLLMNKSDLKAISGLTSIRSEERERARIGKELSQSVGELLIKFKLRMGNLSPYVDSKDRAEFEDTLRIIDMARDEISKVSEVLDPMEFNKLRLDEALRTHIKKLKTKYAVAIDFLNVGYNGQLVKEQELLVYRVLSEMLTAIVENDRMVHCDVRLEVMEHYMSILIQERTKSGNQAPEVAWFTDASFQDRVQIIGGFVHHKSDLEKGNAILIEIPVPDLESATQHRNAS